MCKHCNSDEIISQLRTDVEAWRKMALVQKDNWHRRLDYSTQYMRTVAETESTETRMELMDAYADNTYEILRKTGGVDKVWR